jgi:hypothetical protein
MEFKEQVQTGSVPVVTDKEAEAELESSDESPMFCSYWGAIKDGLSQQSNIYINHSFKKIYPIIALIFADNQAEIKIFNSLPCRLTSLKNEKAEFEVALRRYLNTHTCTLLMSL